LKKLTLFSIVLMFNLLFGQFSLLHSFTGSWTDGEYAYGRLLRDGGTLFGMTNMGGNYGDGTIFKIETSGSGFSLLHSFNSSDITNGSSPYGSLIQDGSTLYGMTYRGGNSNSGTVFSIGTDGIGFDVTRSFDYSDSFNGNNPYGSVIIEKLSPPSGISLYGMTYGGGSNGDGTIFKINQFTGFSILHSFKQSDISNGDNPYGSLIQDGNTLYGMTYAGGIDNWGTIFKIGTNGNGFELLHSFEGGADNGSQPYGSLIQDGSTLYGMTYSGGANSAGTIFKIGTDGNGFELLHSFSLGDATNGAFPYGSLIQDGNTLYGMTYAGGIDNRGTIFKIESSGSGFSVLHSFIGGTTGGMRPFYNSSLIKDGGILYGSTQYGGSNNRGTIFKYVLPSQYVIISGYIRDGNSNPVSGVDVAFSNSGLTATTDATGYYEQFITKGWSGTATPSKAGKVFSPVSRSYSGVSSNQPNQDYTTSPQFTYAYISGYAKNSDGNPMAGVLVEFSNSGQSVLTDALGFYEMWITEGWSGTSTPSMTGYNFTPSKYTYSNVSGSYYDQDFAEKVTSLGIEDLNSVPTSFTVLPAYPNPFNPSTTITYGLDSGSDVSIQIYDITGQLISTLQDNFQTQGWHSVKWNGTNQYGNQVPAGIYLSKVTSSTNTKTTKLMLLK